SRLGTALGRQRGARTQHGARRTPRTPPRGGVLSWEHARNRAAAYEATVNVRLSLIADDTAFERPDDLVPEPAQDAEAEALDAYSRTVSGIAERLAPSVANLRILRATRRGRAPAGGGSGVVLTPDGYLLTSAHVVAGRDRIG